MAQKIRKKQGFNPELELKNWQNKKLRYHLFVDGNNLYCGLKDLGFTFNGTGLKRIISTCCPTFKSRRVFYYNALPSVKDKKRYNSMNKIFNEFRTCVPNIKVQLGFLQKGTCKDGSAIRKEKKVDTMICMDMFVNAWQNEYDCAILVSGDTDMVPSVKAIKKYFPEKLIFVLAIDGRASGELYRLCDRKLIVKKEFVNKLFSLLPIQ